MKRRKPTARELDARPWFVVIESGRQVEILDGPFFVEANALDAAQRHADDGELDACIMQRFEPRTYSHTPLYGPKYAER